MNLGIQKSVNSRNSLALYTTQRKMEGKMKPLVAGGYKRTIPNVNNRRGRGDGSNYFTLQSFLLLICLTASLLILPLILPPLPPPPSVLLLLPIGIFVVLLILAFMPYNVRGIATPYL